MLNSDRGTGDWLGKYLERRKTDKTPLPNGKKDTSGFGGKPFLKREELKGWLKRPEVYQLTKVPEQKRVKWEKELFTPEICRELIEKGEPEKIKTELEKGKWGKFKHLSQKDREMFLRVVKEFKGQ